MESERSIIKKQHGLSCSFGALSLLTLYLVMPIASAQTYQITPSVTGANGTIAPSTVQTVPSGGSAIFTMTPSSGYRVYEVTVDGPRLADPVTAYTFSNVTANHAIAVSFALPDWPFDTAGYREGWSATNEIASGSVANGLLSYDISTTATDPMWESQVMALPRASYRWLRVIAQNATKCTGSIMFWDDNTIGGFTGGYSASYPINPHDTQMSEYWVDMNALPLWMAAATIEKFRFDFPDNAPDGPPLGSAGTHVDVDRITLLPSASGPPTPTVTSITRIDASPTNAASVRFDVRFNHSMSMLSTSDFALATTGGVTGNIAPITVIGPTWGRITVDTIAGTGTLGLNFVANRTARDVANQSVPAGFTGQMYTVDRVPPSVTVNQSGGLDPTNALPVSFAVVFSEAVTGFDQTDITQNGTATGVTWTVTNSGDNRNFTLQATVATTDGTLVPSILAGRCTDPIGNNNTASTSTDNSVALDRAAPTVTNVTSSLVDGYYRAGQLVPVQIAFSENVIVVGGPPSLSLNSGGTATYASGNGSATLTFDYVVLAGDSAADLDCAGIGSLTLNGGTIRDAATNNATITLAAPGTPGSLGANRNIVIDTTPPSATIITPTTPSPTNMATVAFSVTFGETVVNFSIASDVVITPTGTVAYTGMNITGGPSVYTVTITGVTGDGTILLAANTLSDVKDLSGNALASSVTSSAVILDHIRPNATSITPTPPGPTKNNVASFVVHFDEAVQHFNTESDVVITQSGISHSGVTISGGPQDYTVNVVGIVGDGTVGLAVNTAADVQDLAVNPLQSSVTSALVTVDQTPPRAQVVNATTPSPTNSNTVSFAVLFDEVVQNFGAAADVVVTETLTVAHTGVTVIAGGDGQNYVVQVTGVTGDGTMTLAVSTTSDVQDLATNGLASSVTSSAVSVLHTGPSASSIAAQNSNPSASSTVIYDVTFSEDVVNFDNASDVVVTETGVTHTGLTITGGPSHYVVYLTGVSGNGTIRMAVSLVSNIHDQIGNGMSSSVTSAPLTMDQIKPNVTAISPTTPNPTNGTTVSFSVGFSENVQGFNHIQDLVLTETGVGHNTITITGGPQVYTVQIDGIYGYGSMTLAAGIVPPANVIDMAGNPLASSVTSAPVVIDQTNPTVTVNSMITKNQTPGLAGTANDNVDVASVSVSVNGHVYPAVWWLGSWGATVADPLPEGTYDVVVTVTDTAGNTATDTTANELTVDFTPPTVTVTSQITGATTPIISGTVNDNFGVSGVTIRVNGYDYTATVASGAWSGQITHALPLAYAVYDVEVTATDVAENIGHDITTAELTIDPNAPTVEADTLVTNDSTPRVTGSATCSGTATDITNVTVVVNGITHVATLLPLNGSTRRWTVDVTTALPDGNYNLRVTAMDNLARTGSDGTTNELTVDTQPPTADITIEGGTPTNQSSVDFLVAFSEPVTPTFDASDVTLTGSLASAATFQLSGTDPNYAVTVTITDPLADGTIGIQIGGPVSDPALNPYAGGSSPVCRIHNWFGFNLHPQTAYAYEGESHVFSVGASFGESIPAYVWQWDDGMKTIQTVGGDSPTYTIPNVAGKAGKYWCQLTYDGTTYSSNQATLYVAPPVHITQQPQSQTKLIGEACEFNVLATGGFAPLTYEWLKDGVTVSTSTDSTYSIDQVGWNDAGTYRVVVTDTQSGTATSNSVQLVAGQNMPATRLAGLTVLILAFAFLGYRRIAVLRK